jgi:hypothetical protein
MNEKLQERCKADTSGVVSEPGVASTSRAAQAMDIDTDSEPKRKYSVFNKTTL